VPVQRVSRGFKDVSATFQVNPINSDVIILKNENAIARSIRNLIFTVPGEKPFAPTIGSNVTALLFENMDLLTASSIKSEIEYTIINFEPRVNLTDVEVTANIDNNQFDCVIRYDIVGIDVLPQQLTFALQPTR
tara:strand:+ start:2025 stop:2426 length:402 start_codon:yes stop_codon:yes gene_type:complete